ncbi:RING-CH-type domain-containing protein, partial [Psidium guajava]
MGKDNLPPTTHSVEVRSDHCSSNDSDDSETSSRDNLEKEGGMPFCRVCQCVESDQRGDAALGYLGIAPPSPEKSDGDTNTLNVQSDLSHAKNAGRESKFIEVISPEGELFVCAADLEMGHNEDSLLELGCSCKNDLALVHYACALKWFVNHGSTVCEICGQVAKNIRIADFKKVVGSLKEYEMLRERTSSGEPNPLQLHMGMTVDPDAVAAIRRQRLSEISLWFSPHHNSIINNNQSNVASQVASEQPSTIISQDNGDGPSENPATKWAVEGTGILLATGLLTVTLAWLIAPRVGKKTARSGLHILLGGICALTVVVFFRFFVLTRIKYGPARYWAILFVFWFLVFGIWASRTH